MTGNARHLNESPKVDLHADEMEGGKGRFLIDTGAELSIILQRKVKSNIYFNSEIKYILCGIGGTSVSTLGEVKLNVNGTPCHFQVVPNDLPILTDGILGMPLFEAWVH